MPGFRLSENRPPEKQDEYENDGSGNEQGLIARPACGGTLALDFIGTGLAAYLLDAWILLGLDVLAAIAWLATFATPRTLSTAS